MRIAESSAAQWPCRIIAIRASRGFLEPGWPIIHTSSHMKTRLGSHGQHMAARHACHPSGASSVGRWPTLARGPHVSEPPGRTTESICRSAASSADGDISVMSADVLRQKRVTKFPHRSSKRLLNLGEIIFLGRRRPPRIIARWRVQLEYDRAFAFGGRHNDGHRCARAGTARLRCTSPRAVG